MKNIFLYGLLFFSLLISYDCSKISDEELWNQAQTLVEEGKHKEAIEKLKKLVDNHPGSSKAAQAQFMIAAIYNNDLQDYENAITEYKKFLDKFPDDKQSVNALFLIGFIYNNFLHDYEKAKSTYEEFLRKYPEHELAQSAQIEIQTLGKSPEELLPPELAEKEKDKKAYKK